MSSNPSKVSIFCYFKIGLYTNSVLDSNDILIKDSVYTAIGLASCILHPYIDFDSFILNTLVQEIQISQPGYNILRRRIAILLSQWVSVKISQGNRPTLYKITQHLLNKADPMNDIVVRLTAARSLKSSVDEWDFKIDDFLSFASDIFEKIMDLIEEVEETETRMSLVNVIAIIVERLEHHVSCPHYFRYVVYTNIFTIIKVAPFADRIVQILPPLWEQTGEEHLFKQAILSVLSKLVMAMKDNSLTYQSMIISLIRYSVDPANVRIANNNIRSLV